MLTYKTPLESKEYASWSPLVGSRILSAFIRNWQRYRPTRLCCDAWAERTRVDRGDMGQCPVRIGKNSRTVYEGRVVGYTENFVP